MVGGMAGERQESDSSAQPEESRSGLLVLLIPFLLIVAAIFLTAANREPDVPMVEVQGGNPSQGPDAVQRYGCGSCHTIRGVQGAEGKVGPPLMGLAERGFIAGRLPNTPENLVYWIKHPQEIDPGNAMPDLGVSDPAARDIAAYLYTLR